MSNLFKPITPDITELKTGTPIIKQGDRYIVAGIGGDFIPGGSSGGIDTSDATATASDILSPKTAYVDGKLITGAMINNGSISERLEAGNTLTLDSGYYESISISATFSGGVPKQEKLTVTPTNNVQIFKESNTLYSEVTVNAIPQEYVITSDGDATSNDLVYGKSAYVKGAKVEGLLMPLFVRDEQGKYIIDPGYTQTEIVLQKADTGDGTAQPGDVIAGKIFYNAAGRQEGTMSISTPYRDINVVVIPAGVISEETEIVVGNIRQGETILPTSSNQTVANADDFVVGPIVVEGDPNLKPENIVSGVSIFGVVGTASQGDVNASSGATVNANVVTVGKGYLSEDLVVTIPFGQLSYMDNGSGWTLGEGYYLEQRLDVPNGSITIGDGVVTTTPGYIGRKELTIPAGSVSVNTEANKVVVTKGYVTSQEIPLTGGGGTGGLSLVKVTNYHPAREGMSEPYSVTFSGLGTVESQWGDDPADFSDVNGVFVVTEDTKYKKGLARVYKQDGGKYYLCGYDPSDMDWAEYEAHWYVSETVGGYGWSAKMSLYSSSKLGTGTFNWSNENIGTFPVTTTVAMRDYPSLTETYPAQSVTAFNAETAEWTEGDSVDISSYSITPQTNGIYFAQDGKLIGQLIDRELHIPENGLVRRFKAVDGHFVDTVWGTEMMPYGDISYDELGFHGNNPAPMAKTIGSYLSCPNTLSVPKNYTVNVFFKPYYSAGTSAIFEINSEGSDQNSYFFGIWLTSGIAVQCVSFVKNIGSAQPVTPGKWHCVTMTVSWSSGVGSVDGNERVTEYNIKAYIDGKFFAENNRKYAGTSNDFGTTLDYITGNTVRAFGRMHNTSESFTGQIDEACIWDRILTDEEIADMARGLEDFNWDIPKKPYVQEQPVLYAPLTDASKYCPSGQTIYINNTQNTESLSERGFFRNGAFWNYRTNDSGSLEYDKVCIDQNSSSLYTSGSFTVCVDLFVVDYRTANSWQNYDITGSILDGDLQLCSKKGSSNLFMRFKGIDGGSVSYNAWTTLIVRSNKGSVELFSGGALGGRGTVAQSYPFDKNYAWFYGLDYTFKWAIRNIRIYNRAITDEEVAELSGVKETE